MTEITFNLAAGRDAVDLRWGSDYSSQTCHVKIHPNNTRASKAPCLIYIHGGSGILNDARLPFLSGGTNMNLLFTRILANTTQPPFFNIVSVNVPQLNYDLNDNTYPYNPIDTIGNAHSQQAANGAKIPFWQMPRQQERLTWPALFDYTKLFLLWWKSVCADYGSDPNLQTLLGTSFGGIRAQLSQLTGVVRSDDVMHAGRGYYGMKPGVDSSVKALVTQYSAPDVRRDQPYVIAAGGVSPVYPIFNEYIARMANGITTKEALDNVPSWILEAMSLMWYVENAGTVAGVRNRLLPQYQWWERNGGLHGGTNGTTTYPLPDRACHDEQQLFNLEAALNTAGLQKLMRETLIKPTDANDTSTAFPNDAAGRTYAQVLADDIIGWLNEVLFFVQSGNPRRYGHSPIYWNEAGYT